jgi:hypothetical protein
MLEMMTETEWRNRGNKYEEPGKLYACPLKGRYKPPECDRTRRETFVEQLWELMFRTQPSVLESGDKATEEQGRLDHPSSARPLRPKSSSVN